MWYDFSIDQIRFDGDVSLKHFSGAELMRIRGGSTPNSTAAPTGRATYLTCGSLTVDFQDRDDRVRKPRRQRMGRLSADRLRQFQASTSVVLQDDSEGLYLTADRVVYWADRDVLAVDGTRERPVHITTQKPGRLPNQLTVERLFYNLATGETELAKPVLKAGGGR